MPCTTILIGKNATYDGSTIVARNEDSPSGEFCAKRLEVMKPEDQPKVYKSVLSHVEIPLPETPLQYTYLPNSDTVEGIWGAYGVNEKKCFHDSNRNSYHQCQSGRRGSSGALQKG